MNELKKEEDELETLEKQNTKSYETFQNEKEFMFISENVLE